MLIIVAWDIKAVFYAIWSPFTWLVGYVDPRKPSEDVLHGACAGMGWGKRGQAAGI